MTPFTTPEAPVLRSDHAYLRTHRISGDVLRFELLSEVSGLHELAALSGTGRAGKTLVKEDSLRITQLALQKGMRLPWHEVAGTISIQVLRGHLQMVTADGKLDLAPGALVVLASGVHHAGRAMNDCVMLITMSMQEVAGQ
jgi:quercetin dioxygenase-like cupin family protein